MAQEFCIISIDDSREEKKNAIRNALPGWKEAKLSFVNGKDPASLALAAKYWNTISTPGPFKAGEFGIFYSVLNVLEYGAFNDGILYFEDDAIPTIGFQERLEEILKRLPRNADLFALWSPENQGYDYTNVSSYNDKGEPIYEQHRGSIFDFDDQEISRLWQGYGNVAMYVTKRGCDKIIKYIKAKGFFSPIDCLICIGCHTGRINGFSLKPNILKLIDYDWNAPTTIHHSAWGMLDELTKGE